MPMTPRVVDIYWREPLKASDFKAMKQAGIWGVIHKSSEGASFKDKKYAERKKIVLGEGMLWGAYHFANSTNVKAQVDNFLSVAGGDPTTCLVLDWEDNPGSTKMSEKQARDFLGYVYTITGQRPALYGGNTIKEALGMRKDAFFAQHRLWLCQYGPRAKLPPAWDKYWLWQYTGDGVGLEPHRLPGVSTPNMDLNVFQGTIEDLRKSWAPAYSTPAKDIVVPAPVIPKTETQVKSAAERAASWFKGLFK